MEVVVSLPIVLVAAMILLTTFTAIYRQRSLTRENARVVEAMRSRFEAMRNEPFENIVRLYNADPMDDPGGPGTAPGERFPVNGVQPRPDTPDGGVGRIRLPIMNAAEEGELPVWELREDLVDAQLGFPRDIDGNGLVDEADHSFDYRILPILLEAEWQGELGPRTFRMFTVMTDFRL